MNNETVFIVLDQTEEDFNAPVFLDRGVRGIIVYVMRDDSIMNVWSTVKRRIKDNRYVKEIESSNEPVSNVVKLGAGPFLKGTITVTWKTGPPTQRYYLVCEMPVK